MDCPPAKNITNLRLTNWGYYKKVLTKNLRSPPTQVLNGQLDNLVNTFSDICSEAIQKACPSRTVKTKRKPPWWNTTLANLKILELTSMELGTTIANFPGTYTIRS